MGRAPSEEPDVFLDVPNLHVGKLEIDVERLEADLALRAQVANLVNLVAGVHAGVDKVKITLEDVDASALLQVRLQNTYNILDRTLTTIDEHPEILQGALEVAGAGVEQVGDIGKGALQPGGAVGELSSGLGDTLGNLSGSLGNTLTRVTDKINPKRLVSRAGRGAHKGQSSVEQDSGDGLFSRASTGLAATGAAALLGSALYRTTKRPRVLGVPVGRSSGLGKVAEESARWATKSMAAAKR